MARSDKSSGEAETATKKQGFPLSSQKVAETSVRRLRASPSNPRVHSERQRGLLVRSIRRFGFINPVLIDARHRVVAGWGRVEAAKQLGLDTVPTLQLEHLNEEELRAYVLADNRLAEKAGWDRSLLAIELQGLTEIGFDLEAVGFEAAEVDLILDELRDIETEDSSDDEIPKISVKAVSRAGDIWICGKHRLLCDDARSSTAYHRLLNGEKANVVFTDPPYNVKINGHVSGLGGQRHREFLMASGEMGFKEFSRFLERSFINMARHSCDGSLHYVFMDWRHLEEITAAGRTIYSKLINVCVWAKTNAGMGQPYRSQHELIFVWLNGSGKHADNVELGRHGRSRSNVWTYAGVNTFKQGRHEELRMHPTVKPLALVADAIKDCSARGDLVLDPFIGSGTTMVAAEKVGRQARGLEIDPLYVDVAVRRWQAYSGKMAVHAKTGRTFEQTEKRALRLRSSEG